MGTTRNSDREVLGLWSQAAESAKFGMQVLSELNGCGVADILIACVDGLKGFDEAIQAISEQGNKTLRPICSVNNADEATLVLEASEDCWPALAIIGRSGAKADKTSCRS